MANPFISPPESAKQDMSSDRVLKSLSSQYLLIGNTHVRAWKAWLALGVILGLVTTLILIANRSGEFETGRTAPPQTPAAPTPPQKITLYQTAVVGAFIDAPARKIQIIPLSTYYSEDGCIKDINTPSKAFSITLLWEYIQFTYILLGGDGFFGYKLTIPASAALTHGDIPITFADIKPKDFVTIEILIDVATKQVTFTKVDVTNIKLSGGKILAVSPSVVTVRGVGKTGDRDFSIIPQTKIYIGSLTGGIKSATINDLKVGNYVLVGWASAGEVATALQILMQDSGVTDGKFPKFIPPSEVIFGGYLTYEKESKFDLILSSVNELVNGCYKTSYTSGAASVLLPLLTGLKEFSVSFTADTQFSRNGIPISPADGFSHSPDPEMEAMITDVTYNPTDKTWTAKTVELSGRAYTFSGQISDFTEDILTINTNPIPIKVVAETKIFVISPSGQVTKGDKTALITGKKVWGKWIYPVPSDLLLRIAAKIFVQQ